MKRTPRVQAIDPPWADKAHVIGDAWFEAGAWRAGCGTIVHGTPVPARTVDVDRRCGANGCRSRWPAIMRAVS